MKRYGIVLTLFVAAVLLLSLVPHGETAYATGSVAPQTQSVYVPPPRNVPTVIVIDVEGYVDEDGVLQFILEEQAVLDAIEEMLEYERKNGMGTRRLFQINIVLPEGSSTPTSIEGIFEKGALQAMAGESVGFGVPNDILYFGLDYKSVGELADNTSGNVTFRARPAAAGAIEFIMRDDLRPFSEFKNGTLTLGIPASGDVLAAKENGTLYDTQLVNGTAFFTTDKTGSYAIKEKSGVSSFAKKVKFNSTSAVILPLPAQK